MILCSSLEPPPGASPSAWLGILEGRGLFPPEACPGLAPGAPLHQLGNQALGKAPPSQGCSWGQQEGSQGYRASPQGLRRQELPASPPPHHPCSATPSLQGQTLGSWSMRHKIGKDSDQKEDITVQKKPVQPERAPARPEFRAPCPRTQRPARVGGNATEAGAALDWGAVNRSRRLMEARMRLSPRQDNSRAGCPRGPSSCRPEDAGTQQSPIPRVSYTQQAATEGGLPANSSRKQPHSPLPAGPMCLQVLWALHTPHGPPGSLQMCTAA